MVERVAQRWILAGLVTLAGVVQLTGITWGLPSRSVDRFLFGDVAPWTGAQIAEFTGQRPEGLGADVDADPITRRAEPVPLNDSSLRRAQIIRRYRLFSYQPDEMITLMSLASMKPGAGDFDPKLYQYGGLWIYPVGALLKIAGSIGYIDLAQPMTYFLDHPEQFGRFYVVMRLYAVMWGLIGAWAVFSIARDAGAGTLGSAGATVLYTFLPVVVNMSHEAKPHLPSAVLTLLAAMAAGGFVTSGKPRWAIFAAVLAGGASGMILTGALAWAIVPAMLLLRPIAWARRVVAVSALLALALAVYFATNPFVLVHLLTDDSILRSNLANSQAMYQVWHLASGFLNALRLLGEAATPLVVVVGVLGCALRARRDRPTLALLSIVSGLVLVQFVLLAAGKPAEYGRFATLPAIVLAISCGILIGSARIRQFEKLESLAVLAGVTIFCGAMYLRCFLADTQPLTRRLAYAQMLDSVHRLGGRSIGVFDEPAPYLLPPVDLFEWSVLLLPREFDLARGEVPCDVIVRPSDALRREPTLIGRYVRITERTLADVFPSRITWANKAIEIWVRKDLIALQ